MRERDFEAFKAGWNARVDYEGHEWGPSPPDTAAGAWAQWLKICSKGHIIMIHGCTGILPDGRECRMVSR